MKKILSKIAFLSVSFMVTGCMTIKTVNLEPYKRIITVQDKGKEEIYILANCWLVETFVSAEAVVEFQDKEAGKIIGKCNLTTGSAIQGFFKTTSSATIKVVISIDCRDEGARISLIPPENLNTELVESLKIKWLSLADDFEKYLNRETTQW
jgi:hypothetical protein